MAKQKTDAPKRRHSKQVTLRVSPEEYEAFRSKADELDISLSVWIRLTCRRAAGMETP